MKLFGVAVDFLSLFSVKTSDYTKGDIGRAAVYFPFVGLVIGVIVGFCYVLLQRIVSPMLSAVLSLALWSILTGFLHLEGFSHCVSGLFSSETPEKRLAMLKDSSVSTLAVVTLILYFLLKAAALETLLPGNPEWTILLVAYASVMGRWVVVFIAQISVPAKPDGVGAEFKLGFQESTWWISLLLPVVMTILGSYLLGIHILVAGLLVVLLGWGISLFTRRQLGGFTGDVLGMAVELAELVCLLVFSVR